MKSQYYKLFAFVALLLAVGLACNFLSGPATTEAPVVEEPPVAEQPQAEESSSEPTEAPVATEPPASESSAEPYFTEEFEGSLDNWSQEVALNASDGDTSQANISVEDGRVVFDFGKWLIGYIFYDAFDYEDVRVDVSVENRGTNVNNILLVCRASEEGHYLVNVANSGLFAMYAYNGDKGSYVRIADGGSNKIKAGKEINEYALVCKERKLTLYINGNEARSYTDNQFVFRKGQIGVGVASENQLPVKVEFDWVKISEP
jgi:hypothetical protein